jgi:hypothetical protein
MNRWRVPKPGEASIAICGSARQQLSSGSSQGLRSRIQGRCGVVPHTLSASNASAPTWIKRRADLGNGGNAIPQLNPIKLNRSLNMWPPASSNRSKFNAEHSPYFSLAEANWFPKENWLWKETGRLCYPALSSPAVALPAPETHHLPTDSPDEANFLYSFDSRPNENTWLPCRRSALHPPLILR